MICIIQSINVRSDPMKFIFMVIGEHCCLMVISNHYYPTDHLPSCYIFSHCHQRSFHILRLLYANFSSCFIAKFYSLFPFVFLIFALSNTFILIFPQRLHSLVIFTFSLLSFTYSIGLFSHFPSFIFFIIFTLPLAASCLVIRTLPLVFFTFSLFAEFVAYFHIFPRLIFMLSPITLAFSLIGNLAPQNFTSRLHIS